MPDGYPSLPSRETLLEMLRRQRPTPVDPYFERSGPPFTGDPGFERSGPPFTGDPGFEQPRPLFTGDPGFEWPRPRGASNVDPSFDRGPRAAPPSPSPLPPRDAFLEMLRPGMLASGNPAAAATGDPLTEGFPTGQAGLYDRLAMLAQYFGNALPFRGAMRGVDPAAETLVGYGRRMMPSLYRIFDKLPDIQVRRGAELPKGEVGRYTPQPRPRPYQPPPEGLPGGTIDIRSAPPSLYDEVVGLTHEGRHALEQQQPMAGFPSQWARIMARLRRRGDLPPDVEMAYRQHGGLHGPAHAVLEGLAQRAVRQGWPAGLPKTATAEELDAALRALGR
jgi:hypothetical protein